MHTTRALLRIAFWAGVVVTFTGAVLPGEVAPQVMWDKAEHFCSFYVLAVLGALAHPRRALLVPAIWLSAFGAFIEIVQLIPALHRDADVWDWVADTLGIAAAIAPVTLTRLRALLVQN